MDSNGENQYMPFSYFRNVAGFAIAPTLLRCHRSHAIVPTLLRGNARTDASRPMKPLKSTERDPTDFHE